MKATILHISSCDGYRPAGIAPWRGAIGVRQLMNRRLTQKALSPANGKDRARFKLGARQRRKGRAPTTFQAGQPNRGGRPKPRALNGGEQARWHPLFGGGLRYAK